MWYGFGRFWNRTEPLLGSKSGRLAGYQDALQTVTVSIETIFDQFLQYHLDDVSQLWQLDELHQLLLNYSTT